MIVGENSRSGDMDVNPTKEKKLTNIRTHSHDESLRLTPPRPITLETAIEFIAADELVEVTPMSIRLRKRPCRSTTGDARRAGKTTCGERRARGRAAVRAVATGCAARIARVERRGRPRGHVDFLNACG